MATTATRLMMVLVMAACALLAGMTTYPEWFTGMNGAERKGGSTLASASNVQTTPLTRRIKQRIAIAQQVVDGEMDLLSAASWYKELEVASASPQAPPLRPFPGRSEGERLCQEVLLYVREVQNGQGVSLQDASSRLAELQQEMASAIGLDGKVVLP